MDIGSTESEIEKRGMLLKKGEIDFQKLNSVGENDRVRYVLHRLIKESRSKPIPRTPALSTSLEEMYQKGDKVRICIGNEQLEKQIEEISGKQLTPMDKMLLRIQSLGSDAFFLASKIDPNEVIQVVLFKSDEKVLVHELKHVADCIVHGEDYPWQKEIPSILAPLSLLSGTISIYAINSVQNHSGSQLEFNLLMGISMGILGIGFANYFKYINNYAEKRARNVEKRVEN